MLRMSPRRVWVARSSIWCFIDGKKRPTPFRACATRPSSNHAKVSDWTGYLIGLPCDGPGTTVCLIELQRARSVRFASRHSHSLQPSDATIDGQERAKQNSNQPNSTTRAAKISAVLPRTLETKSARESRTPLSSRLTPPLYCPLFSFSPILLSPLHFQSLSRSLSLAWSINGKEFIKVQPSETAEEGGGGDCQHTEARKGRERLHQMV